MGAEKIGDTRRAVVVDVDIVDARQRPEPPVRRRTQDEFVGLEGGRRTGARRQQGGGDVGLERIEVRDVVDPELLIEKLVLRGSHGADVHCNQPVETDGVDGVLTGDGWSRRGEPEGKP